jgi:hypothetical protein
VYVSVIRFSLFDAGVMFAEEKKVIPWSRVLLEKLKVTQLIKQFTLPFMEPEGSLTCSQEPGTGPYPEPDESSSHHQTLFP